MNATRRNNRLYVRLITSSPGTVVGGETLPALPASVRSMLDDDKTVATAPGRQDGRRRLGAAPRSRGPRLARADAHADVLADRRRLFRCACACCLDSVASLSTLSRLPARRRDRSFWTIATAAEFLRGTSDGVFVSLNGVVSPGPALTNRLTSTPAQVWSLTEAADGTLLAPAPAATAGCCACAPDSRRDGVRRRREQRLRAGRRRRLASTPRRRPTARSTSIEGNGGRARRSSIRRRSTSGRWRSMRSGRAVGRRRQSCGDLSRRADGTARSSTARRAAHVVSLARDGDRTDAGRHRVAGPALPLRRRRSAVRAARLRHDRIARGRPVDRTGVVFAAAVSPRRRRRAGERRDDQRRGDASRAGGRAGPARHRAPASSRRRPGARCCIASIRTAHGSRSGKPATSSTTSPRSRRGGVLVATGPEGRLYGSSGRATCCCSPAWTRSRSRDSRPRPKPARGCAAFATANPGRVIASAPGSRPTPAYVSAVRDTKSVATWGLIRWEGAGP